MGKNLSKSDGSEGAVNLLSLLKNFPFPSVIIDANKNVLWKNEEFENNYSDKIFSENKINDSEATYIPLVINKPLEKYLVFFPHKSKEKNNGIKELKNLSHDLNNILLSILNSVEILKKKLEGKSEYDYLLKNIEISTKRAAELTEDAMSAKETSSIITKKVNVKRLLFELAESLNQTVTRNVILTKNFDDNINNINGNYNRLYRALLNLIVNAKEAIDDKGEIKLSAENVSLQNKKTTLDLNDGSYIKISVEDNGIGIEEENLSKIFDEKFSTKEKGRESGFGLNIVKKIIEEHSGKISVISEKGKGTKFEIYLPALIKAKMDKSKSEDKTKTILLADDEDNLRDLLAELLESHNYRVVHASDGIEVIDKLTEFTDVDLLIIDRKMPKMDGLSSIRIVREMNYDIPVLLVSGSPYHGSVDKLRKLKIGGVLNKPYDFEKMLEVIEDLISA